jgi:hypothetical protein
MYIHIYFENEGEEAVGCTNEQVRFEMNVVTDRYRQDNSWTLVNNRTDETV